MDFPRPTVMVNLPPPPPSSSQRTSFTTTISADKALQYTPFTACLLPVQDRIPIPQVVRAQESNKVSRAAERKDVQPMFQDQHINEISNRLSILLNRDSPSTGPILFRKTPTQPVQNDVYQRDDFLRDLGLSKLARSVLSMTKFEYNYPPPVSSKRYRRNKTEKTPVPSRSKSSDTKSKPNETPISKVYSETKPKQPAFVTQVPPPPVDYEREEYVVISGSPKRRKVSHDGQDVLQARSQKQVSDNALNDFQDLLSEIFEGQDLIDNAGGTVSNPKSLEFFSMQEISTEAGTFTLNLRTLERLRIGMKKLFDLRRLGDVPVDSLRRLKEICEPSIEAGKDIDIRLPSDSQSEEMDHWTDDASKANNAVCCAIVFAYIILGNPNKEELLSNETLSYTARLLENVLDNSIIPVIEARPDATDNQIFQTAALQRDSLRAILESSRKLLEIMTMVCTNVKGGDHCINTIEFLAARLIFVQNGTSEKTSVLGLQVYEKFRKGAMATLSRMYARFPAERKAILDEILTSLDKLPSTSRSARQFRLGDGTSIQLISALFMQLVQTTAMQSPKTVLRKTRRGKQNNGMQFLDQDEGAQDDQNQEVEIDEQRSDESTSLEKLDAKVNELYNTASRSAQDIIAFLTNKASGTTKTGDSPYRSILDLLVEDLVLVLPSYDWPSAEMLLRYLAIRMLDLAQNEKAVSVKNMALESLGVMGSAISQLRVSIPQTLEQYDHQGKSEVSSELVRLGDTYLQHSTIPGQELVGQGSPFWIVTSYLNKTASQTALQIQSARSYFLTHYGKLISFTINNTGEADSTIQLESVIELLLQSLNQPGSNVQQLEGTATEAQAKLAYLLCILNLSFCRRLQDIVKTLSSSFSSDQAQVRSRSLKSVAVILEIDSSLLDRDATIADDIFRCASDDSAMVRDSALSLIARFIVPRKALESKGIKRLLECAADEKIGVSKRAIGHLKEIYLREHRDNVKEAIARRVLERFDDHEESIATFAEQTLEEIWTKPLVGLVQADDKGASTSVGIQNLASHLMACVTPSPEIYLPKLNKFFGFVLRLDQKSSKINHKLCSLLVRDLFDRIISSEKTQAPLMVLTALAEANPKLMPASQLTKLKNYLSDFKTDLDLFMFRSAVGIFYHVLPDLSDTHKTLLKSIQDDLITSLTKLGRRSELDAVAQCLSIIDGILKNTERLVKFTKSIFKQLTAGIPVHQLVRILRIAGALAKFVDLDKHAADFARDPPPLKIISVSAHFAKTILPHCLPSNSLEVRQLALESLGSVCQASPAQFNIPQVRRMFFEIMDLNGDHSDSTTKAANIQLQATILKVFDELYATRAASKEQSNKNKEDEEEVQGLKQMGGDAKLRDQDSAISSITMDIVERTTKIATSDTSENAFLAAKTLASISHQGLIHPKQCLGTFVALGTSKNSSIASVGQRAQKLLHEQHESHCEREYMSAIQQAFCYQADVGESSCGAIQPGSRAKLAQCFDIVATSSTKSVKRFLSGLVSRTSFENDEAGQPKVSAENVQFTRFIVQNLAFVEYKKLDELLHLMLQLEMTYPTSGAEIVQAIETAEQQYPDMISQQPMDPNSCLQDELTTVEIKTRHPEFVLALKRLATAAACILLLIEAKSYLRRQYGILDVRQAMTNSKQTKDTSKAPTKVHGITGEKFWNRSNEIVEALENEETTVEMCKSFVHAMNEEERLETQDDRVFEMDTTEMNATGSVHPKSATPGGRKRKLSVSASNTPTKKARGRHKKIQRQSSSISSKDNDSEGDYEG